MRSAPGGVCSYTCNGRVTRQMDSRAGTGENKRGMRRQERLFRPKQEYLANP